MSSSEEEFRFEEEMDTTLALLARSEPEPGWRTAVVGNGVGRRTGGRDFQGRPLGVAGSTVRPEASGGSGARHPSGHAVEWSTLVAADLPGDRPWLCRSGVGGSA